jgi:hypothetical protein
MCTERATGPGTHIIRIGPQAQLFNDPDRPWYSSADLPAGWSAGNWAPHNWSKTGDGIAKGPKALTRLDVLRGQHTAVTFINAAGQDIHSNNPANAVPEDAKWIDQDPSSARRTIFFYARRWPKQLNIAESEKGIDHCTYFGGLSAPPAPSRLRPQLL